MKTGADVTSERFAVQLRGLHAASELEVMRPVLMERRESLIRQAIGDFNAHKLTEQSALLFVAALVENQRLVDDLEHIEKQGRRAGQKLHGT